MRPSLLVCHALLLGACAALVASAPLGTAPRVALLVAVAAPLLLAVPGLLAGRRYTLQWLAILLVLYIGGAMVELVVRGRAAAAVLALLAALAELALLLTTLRNRSAVRG